jgi:hypothetical protein
LAVPRFEGKHKVARGIVVVHEDFHLIEVLVGTQLGGAFDGQQISRRVGFTDPVLSASVVKACPAVS